MSQLISVSSPSSGREVVERYARVRRALFPAPPPQPRVPATRPAAKFVYDIPIVIRGPTKKWLERKESTKRRKASEERRIAAVEAALRAEVPADERYTTILAIVDATAEQYGLTRQTILSESRLKEAAMARHVAMFIAADRRDMSFNQMGHVFGRDHSSVFHAMKKVRALVEQGGQIAADVEAIRARLLA